MQSLSSPEAVGGRMANDPIQTFKPSQAEAAFDAARQDAKVSAFPWRAEIYDRGFVLASGLTKREYYAAMAMQGLLSKWDGCTITTQTAANLSIDAADALLAKLENTP